FHPRQKQCGRRLRGAVHDTQCETNHFFFVARAESPSGQVVIRAYLAEEEGSRTLRRACGCRQSHLVYVSIPITWINWLEMIPLELVSSSPNFGGEIEYARDHVHTTGLENLAMKIAQAVYDLTRKPPPLVVRGGGYSRQFSFFREPMPREPSFDGAVEAEVSTGAETVASFCAPEEAADAGWSGETLSRNVAVGTKNRFPV